MKPLTRLESLMMFAACLSRTEAQGCIRDYRAGLAYSGEAVNHYGGTRAVIERAIQLRTNYTLRELLK
jgi:hypothetical protein